MTEKDFQRGIRLVRYGGLVVTITVFVVLLGFSVVVQNAIGAGDLVGPMMPYIVGFTIFSAVLSIVVYFAYRAYLMGRLKPSTAS